MEKKIDEDGLKKDKGLEKQKKGEPATEKKAVNNKAVKFQEFLADNDINVFSTESLDDDLQTVIFRSRIETKGQILPMAVLIDTSVFTIIRTELAMGISADKKERIESYLNELNAQYKIFKYYLRQDGIVYVDACLPFVDETFDSRMIQLMLSVLVQHLDAVYSDFMAQMWGPEEAEEQAKNNK